MTQPQDAIYILAFALVALIGLLGLALEVLPWE